MARSITASGEAENLWKQMCTLNEEQSTPQGLAE